ncbi:MAG: ribonuclease HII [Candidatus Micrarchaeaceae archaeon]
MLIAGGDEAGRGAVIGPLVISIVSISNGKESKLAKIGVRDSKMLTKRKREFLFDEIYSLAEEINIYKITNNEINIAMSNKISINELEALNFAKLIDSIKKRPEKIFLDSPDVISERFGVRVGFFSKNKIIVDGVKYTKEERKTKDKIKVVSQHKADSRYPVVSAASIISKVTRDKEIEHIIDKTGVAIGSGYPSDSYTISAIRENLGNGTLMPYLRHEWHTIKNIRQLKIEDFLLKK